MYDLFWCDELDGSGEVGDVVVEASVSDARSSYTLSNRERCETECFGWMGEWIVLPSRAVSVTASALNSPIRLK
jgi:hypothetical protein